VKRGCPLGDADWVARRAKQLGLESTLRSRGRPRKDEHASRMARPYYLRTPHLVTGFSGPSLLKKAAAKKIAKKAADIAAKEVGEEITKAAAERAAKKAVKALSTEMRSEARVLVDATDQEVIHHINTLTGHPPYPGRPSRPSEFPTLGVEWFANCCANLTKIPIDQPGKHIWLHQRAYIAC